MTYGQLAARADAFAAALHRLGVRAGDRVGLMLPEIPQAAAAFFGQLQMEQLTGARLTVAYGLTEAAPATHSNPFQGKRVLGSVGIPLPGTEMKVVDLETGEREVEPGEPGELCIRGPQVMQGYHNSPEESRCPAGRLALHRGHRLGRCRRLYPPS